MADAILDALGDVLTRWTMGGNARMAAPPHWREALGDDAPEAELRLLALSGQFLGTLTLMEPAGELRPLADLPRLAKPALPETLRPRARRLLRDPARRRALLDFLDGRGRALHPGDWLPGPHDDVPALYAPWQDWAVAADRTDPAVEILDAESWDRLPPAALRAAFADLRRRAPAQAAVLLAQKIGSETADVRVRLLELLAYGLSDADRPLLDGLAGDRAPRVKTLAASLLARLGHGVDGGEDAMELAAFFPVQTKGLLRRTRIIVPQPLKTPAQRNRRAALMDSLPFAGLADALEATAQDLVQLWPWGSDPTADRALAEMAARSAPDAIVALVAEALDGDPYRLAPLIPRLTSAHRRAAALQLLRAKGSFTQALDIVGGDGRMDDILRMPAASALLGQVRAQDAKPGDQSGELLALGLIASRTAARQALGDMAAAGMIASDPRLDMLRLNAALDQEGAS